MERYFTARELVITVHELNGTQHHCRHCTLELLSALVLSVLVLAFDFS